MLAEYDQFQFDNNIKGDYANVQGLQVFDDEYVDDECDGWIDWHCRDGQSLKDHLREGNDISALVWEGRRRYVIVVVDDTGEYLHKHDVTGWSEKRVQRRIETFWDRLDATAVTVYDTETDDVPAEVKADG